MGNPASTLGANIRRLRESRKPRLSREKMAEDLETTGTTIYNWEKGNHSPDADTIGLLAEYFKVSIADLFGEHPKAEAIPSEQLETLKKVIRDEISKANELVGVSNLSYSGVISQLKNRSERGKRVALAILFDDESLVETPLRPAVESLLKGL